MIQRGKDLSELAWKELGRALKDLLPNGVEWKNHTPVRSFRTPADSEEAGILVSTYNALQKMSHVFNCIELTYDEDDPRLPRIRERLEELRTKFDFLVFEKSETLYSRSDVLDAPFCVLSVRTEVLEVDLQHREDVDLSSACTRCWSGAEIIGPLRADTKSSAASVVGSTREYVGVSLSFAERLLSENLSGLRLVDVVHYKSKKPLPWRMLDSEVTLNAAHRSTDAWTRSKEPCTCGRDSHFESREANKKVVYESKTVERFKQFDLVKTWECFGQPMLRGENPTAGFIAAPKILVGKRLSQILAGLKIKRLELVPIQVVS